MQSAVMKKLVYTDSQRDIALTGNIISEDDFFIIFLSQGREYRIGKKSIVSIKEVSQ
jgi:hypothetical protein